MKWLTSPCQSLNLDRDQIHYSDDFFIILLAVTTTAATTTTTTAGNKGEGMQGDYFSYFAVTI